MKSRSDDFFSEGRGFLLITLNADLTHAFWKRDEAALMQSRVRVLMDALVGGGDPEGVLGWVRPSPDEETLRRMEQKALEIRRDADVFVLVGVGGSNQGARAVIKALDKEGPEILYAGNTLSAYELSRTLARLEGKRVYMNVIAKNFETLEPGSHFRVLRDWLGRSCPKGELADRIVLTGTRGSRLNEIALEHGYTFFDFPTNIGGRYSAHSAVGLFPMAVAGVDIRALLRGAERMAQSIRLQGENSAACQYAVIRNALYGAGFSVDMLCAFEPRLRYFMKWFVQLIGESEGKENRGFFPAGCIYSEDLHSMGQYVQEGRRNLMETFLTVEDAGASLPVPPDPDFRDGFDYLDGMDFAQINLAAQEASIRAHAEGGVPVMRVCVPRLDEEAFGALFYFFEFGCALSGLLAGINPFDQPGVEAYKQRMFQTLGKKENDQ